MRFLFNTILWLPADPTPQQLHKVKTTSEWMHNRLTNLNPVSGGSRQASRRASPQQETVSRPGSRQELQGLPTEGHGKSPDVPLKRPQPLQTMGRVSSIYGMSSRQGHEAYSTGNSPGSNQNLDIRASSEPIEKPDFLYQAVRLAALIYSRAIMVQAPISETCTPAEFLRVWTATRRVPLSAWKAAGGVFQWVMLAMAPVCHGTAQAREVKSMLLVSVLSLGLENWHVSMDSARAGLRVQQWLSQGSRHGAASSQHDDRQVS